MNRWSLADVEKAAPDPASLAAARKLARPGPWSEAGSTDTLVWGKCQGSGRTPYQVSVDLTGPAFRCSCPSRKFPCKHALALLLIWARADGEVSYVAEPADFAGDWAAQRAGRAATAAADAAAKKPDPAARAARQQERIATMTAGLEDFSLWLADLLRGGTAAARRQPWAWWDAAAARLVDAQLPGLAERVRTMASEVNRRDDWSDHLLSELGRWWTATRAWPRRDELDEAARGDLRGYLGWAWARDDIRAADAVTDRWQVLGAHRDETGGLQQQRTWLCAESTGELVRILDFAGGSAALPVSHLTGTLLRATLSRYPGSRPRRALFADDPVADPPSAGGPGTDGSGDSRGTVLTGSPILPPGHRHDPGLGPAQPESRGGTTRGSGLAPGTLADAYAELAGVWAANPWATLAPVVVTGSIAVAGPERYLVDTDGARVDLLLGSPAEPVDPWPLLAVTGGHPHTYFGELQEGGFRPLSLLTDDGLVAT